jgi:hypothetical protein
MAPKGAELPRSVRKGPQATVTCECGQSARLRYGERWNCPGCGRKFDTTEISADAYAEIRRQQLRSRILPLISTVLLVFAVIILFLSGQRFAAVLAIPFVVVVWGLFARPLFRSR